MMSIGNDNHIAWIIWPPTGRNKCCYKFILIDNILLAVIFALASLHEQTERASIILWCVIKHVFYLFIILNLLFTFLSFGLKEKTFCFRKRIGRECQSIYYLVFTDHALKLR